MRALVCSDLHLDFHKDHGRSLLKTLPKDVDLIIVAGDLCEPQDLGEYLEILCSQYPQVIYVSGNHDLYHCDPESVYGMMAEINDDNDNLHWLNNTSIEIDGVTFAGTSLWFERPMMDKYFRQDSHELNDFNLIKDFVPWVYNENERCRQFLDENINNETVVISHHAPSNKSINARYQGSSLNKYFVSPKTEGIIVQHQPRVWIHGHMHDYIEYDIDGTHVVCNPLGYPHESSGFNQNLVLDL